MESFFPNKTQDDRNVDTALTIMKKIKKWIQLVSTSSIKNNKNK